MTGAGIAAGEFGQQLAVLDGVHCGWLRLSLDPLPLSIVGGRPCSSGGVPSLKAVEAVYGPVSLEESVQRITSAAAAVPEDQPLVVMAHSGPTSLGSPASPCGRDWKARHWTGAIRIWPWLSIASLAIAFPIWWCSATCITSSNEAPACVRAWCVIAVARRISMPPASPAAVATPGISSCCISHGRNLRTSLTHLSHRWYQPDGQLMHQELLPRQEPLAC